MKVAVALTEQNSDDTVIYVTTLRAGGPAVGDCQIVNSIAIEVGDDKGTGAEAAGIEAFRRFKSAVALAEQNNNKPVAVLRGSGSQYNQVRLSVVIQINNRNRVEQGRSRESL